MGEAQGFTFETRKSGEVVVRHHGRVAATLRGKSATTFLTKANDGSRDEQQALMARVTGNYKRGNEHRTNRPT